MNKKNLEQLEEFLGECNSLPEPQLACPFEVERVVDLITDTYNYCKNNYSTFLNANEIDVNDFMHKRMNKIRKNNKYKKLVEYVSFEEPQRDYLGNGFRAFPDLSIFFTDKTNYVLPLKIECKIVENDSSSRSIRNYCLDGLVRFVEGKYSWWSDTGVIIAYVRNNNTIDCNFREHLQKRSRKKDPYNYIKYKIISSPDVLNIETSETAYTLHNRSFKYKYLIDPSKNTIPGPIKVWHIWLD